MSEQKTAQKAEPKGKPEAKAPTKAVAVPKKLENELPLATVIRIAKKNGAERVGEDAALMLAKLGEAHIAKIVKTAMTYAKVAGRKTLKKEDLDIAIKPKSE